ncbi:NmrA/HSCARG family protein [Streptomyces sp. NPDC051362]|uniref:NmrA/HSCARG family protein n=1 Tax=Streptomyces sp. NPDC051362 TaxID=3365651 RepID=UPI0037A0B167
MTSQARTVLVTGATGQQGGATARHLLTSGWRVRALVRDPLAPAARELARLGAELTQGSMDDRTSLDAAARGAYGVYSVQPANIAPHFAENELQRGINVADAAHDAKVQHLVYSSVASAERNTGIPHWETKWQVEQHIRSLGLPWTVLRPVMFMENQTDPFYWPWGEQSAMRMVPPNATVQLIALRDIGAFAALAFADVERYVGQAIELAGDELTTEQMLSAIRRAIGHPLPPLGTKGPAGEKHTDTYREQPISFASWQADIQELRKRHPTLMNFDTWLAREGAAQIQTLLSTKASS